MDITLTLLRFLLTGYLVYSLFKKSKKIDTKNAILAKVSLDYVNSNREAQKYKRKYYNLLHNYNREVGFKK